MSKKIKGWKKPATKVIAGYLKVEHTLWAIGSFFAFLPMLHSETSGSKASLPVRAWKDFVFDPSQTLYSKANIRRVSFLQKHDLIDPDYAKIIIRDHASTSVNIDSGDKGPCDEVERILKYDREGLWDLDADNTAATMLGAIAKSYNPSNYNEETGELYSDMVEIDEKTDELYSPVTVVDKKHKAQIAQAKGKMLAWAKEKAASIGNVDTSSHPTLPESLTEIFFSAIVKDENSSLEHENFTFLPLSKTGSLLCTIFKKTTSNTGEPFVYCSSLINSYLPLSEMVKELSGMEDAGFRPAENILRHYKETQYTP